MATAKKAAKAPAKKAPVAKKAPAAKKAAPAKAAPKTAAAAGAPVIISAPLKPIAKALNKSQLIAHLATTANVDAKAAKAVMAALEATMIASLSKKGAKAFVMPGVFKATTVAKPATKARKGINPFTKQEVMFAAKPASVKVRLRALKKVNEAIG